MKKAMIFLFITVFMVSFAAPLFAAEEESGDIVTGTVKTVGKAVAGTAETVASPVVATGRAMTGEGSPDKVVTDPVKKGGETVYDATVDTGKTLTGQKVSD